MQAEGYIFMFCHEQAYTVLVTFFAFERETSCISNSLRWWASLPNDSRDVGGSIELYIARSWLDDICTRLH